MGTTHQAREGGWVPVGTHPRAKTRYPPTMWVVGSGWVQSPAPGVGGLVPKYVRNPQKNPYEPKVDKERRSRQQQHHDDDDDALLFDSLECMFFDPSTDSS